MITGKLRDFLAMPDPIIIQHKLKLAGNPSANEKIFDLEVEIDFP